MRKELQIAPKYSAEYGIKEILLQLKKQVSRDLGNYQIKSNVR